MSQYVKPITLEKTSYSHPSSGRQGIFYTLHVDGKPLHMDTWMTPDAGKYTLLFAAAPELLEALEKCLGLIESEIYIPEPGHICGGPDSMCDSDCAFAASAYGIINRARAAIAKAKGGGDDQA